MMKKGLIMAMTVLCLCLASGCSSAGKEGNPVNQSDETISEEGKEESADNTKDGQNREKLDVKENEDNQIVIGEDVKLTADNPITYKLKNVSVHDPSVIKVNDTFYIFGSHLAGAKSTDFMNWTLIGNGVKKSNPIIPNATEEMKEAFTWAKTNTFWAPDVVQLADGKYYMYYCNCEGSSPLSCLGIAVSDNVEGPYKNLGIILKSGMESDELSEDGDTYDATRQPNVVDPCVFYDKEGRLWMMYGSYSGGIFILELNPETGTPLEKGYGKRILGGNHVRIEGAYVQYVPETDYYYMFLSFGGLASDGGYNIRVVRSKNPDGPYYDAAGNDMINCKGADGTFFDDNAIYKYGTKLMGNFRFDWVEGEKNKIRRGYVSPGHNSTYYNENTHEFFLIFHTRFEGKGETHQVRVHQMYMNENGWPVVLPYRYTGETFGTYKEEDVAGIYKYINHGNSISADVTVSKLIELKSDHTIIGAVTGNWQLKGDGKTIEITIGDEAYSGVVTKQWDEQGEKNVMVFSALSEKGIAIWGSGLNAIE
ncbi:MAG: GH43-C domain-containing protein [Lachnoclostridium sp.]